MYNELENKLTHEELKYFTYKELLNKLTHEELKYFMTFEFQKIDLNTVSRFIVNSDIKDFLIEYLWEVNAPDLYIDLIDDLNISSRRMNEAYDLLIQDGLFFVVLPSGSVVSWI